MPKGLQGTGHGVCLGEYVTGIGRVNIGNRVVNDGHMHQTVPRWWFVGGIRVAADWMIQPINSR